MDFLKKELNDVGFLYPKDKAKSMIENIETMLIRASLSKTEIQTLWGMIKKLRKQAKNEYYRIDMQNYISIYPFNIVYDKKNNC